MELLYLWINNAKDFIIGQEFNFSPVYRFKVDNPKNPKAIEYCKSDEPINIMNIGNISNITAIVGSNGAGKTTILNYLANNDCIYKLTHGEGYEVFERKRYEYHKSIYVFLKESQIVIYHNLEHDLIYPDDIFKDNVYWNNHENKIPQLYEMNNQMVTYLTNSSYVPDNLLQYSKSGNAYKINLHMKSLYLIANRFYNLLWNVNEFSKINVNTPGFVGIVKRKRDERTFQELLDILYYSYLLKHNIVDYVGKFIDCVYVHFESIFVLCDDVYHKDIERLEYMESLGDDLDGELKLEIEHENSVIYYKKRTAFYKKYNTKILERMRRKNATIVLYINLLFEAYFYKSEFELPNINFDVDIYEQLSDVFKENDEYQSYLEDIKNIDDILNEYKTYENIIDNPDDLACIYDKVIDKNNEKFYNFIENAFSEHKAYFLRYIRICNLEMSSGERAMQNLFSWLVLIPKLDQIMSIERETYTSRLLLIDEIDLYSHPEWQRKTICQLIDTINKVETMPVQIVLTSHSPIILSDFPQNNVVYLRRSDTEKLTISDDASNKKTFGANIYTLFNNTFFMERGIMGEYARRKIYDVYEQIKTRTITDKDECQYFINLIGDYFLKKEMQKLFDKKYGENKYDKN